MLEDDARTWHLSFIIMAFSAGEIHLSQRPLQTWRNQVPIWSSILTTEVRNISKL